MNIKNMIQFWKSDNSKVSIVRDVVVALLVVFVILMILWGYTGQWFAAPMVAIESGSMEHPNFPFGRLGTIDAGDMVLGRRSRREAMLSPMEVNSEVLKRKMVGVPMEIMVM